LGGTRLTSQTSGRLPATADVLFPLQVTPDGALVVYLADRGIDGTFELFSAPVDGSRRPVKLNGWLARGGDVLDGRTSSRPFRLSPDGKRVVYRADQRADEVFELFSVPIDRSSEPIRISGDLPTGGEVEDDFAITPDGLSVLYRADQRTDGEYELFCAPIDRAGESVRVSARLVSGGDVGSYYGGLLFQVTPDSTRVSYIADQDSDEVYELYLSILRPTSSDRPVR